MADYINSVFLRHSAFLAFSGNDNTSCTDVNFVPHILFKVRDCPRVAFQLPLTLCYPFLHSHTRQTAQKECPSMLIDWSLIVTLSVIFLITLVGAWLRTRRKDECLKSFDGYQITLERTDNRVVWGNLHLSTTGLELLYREAIQDDQHIESSYVLYGTSYNKIQAIYRYADDLTEENKKRRERDLTRWFHPGPLRYLIRKLRNFITTASESLNEVIGVVVGHVRQPASGYITETQRNAHIQQLGSQVIGHAGSST